MAESQHFSLKYFHYGLLVRDGKPASNQPGLIASTPGLSEGIVQECLRMAPLPPPSPEESTNDMPGALGLFRAGTTSYILAKAQFNEAGFPQVMYVLIPIETLRRMAGNVMALSALAKTSMPAFSAPRSDLDPLILPALGAQSDEDQIVAVSNLVFECEDSLDTVEGILGAIVQGWPVAIVNSPPDIDLRLHFLQGVINMIPRPARIGLTYATHLNPQVPSPAQLKFSTALVQPERHLIYDWGNGKLLNKAPEDPYSHYIVSQLRLDPAMVVQQTAEFGRTMVWRASLQDNLSTALAWVSRRAAVDQAVREGQPAGRETVGAILREDPTLPDDVRELYARHVLAFALALDEPDAADVIPVVAAEYHMVAEAARELLEAHMNKGHSRLVYKMLERWMLQIEEASAFQWQSVLHLAAQRHFTDLLTSGEQQQAIYFLNFAQSADPKLHLNEALGHLIEAGLEAAQSDPGLAQTLFILAIENLPAGQFQRLMANEYFIEQLPPETRATLQHLQGVSNESPPPDLLTNGASVFEARYRSQILARFIEWAAYQQRLELIDSASVQALVELAQSEHGPRFAPMMQQVANDLADSQAVSTLNPLGLRSLVQLLLQTDQSDRAISLLEYYQDTLFGINRLPEFTKLAGDIFELPSLPTATMTTALETLDASKVRPEPRIRMFLSVLETGQWSSDLEYAARRLTGAIFNDCQLLQLVGSTNALRLLDFYYRLRNPLDALRVATALIDYVSDKPKEGASLVAQIWPLITWDAEITEAATELLRRFIRRAPIELGPKLIDYLSRAIGPKTGSILWSTHLMRMALGGSDMETWAEDIHITAQMLIDIAAIYHSEKELPPNHRLRRDLDTMTGGLTDDERAQIARNIATLTQQILELGRNRSKKRNQSLEEKLVQGQISPQNGVDLLRFVGGHFAERRAVPLNLEREAMMHVFGNRSASMFLQETTAMTHVLASLQNAFATASMPAITPEALAGELESLWNTLSLYNQRRLQKQLAKDCQQLAEVLGTMADRGSDKILSEKGLGRQLLTGKRQPRTSLETLRWITGYFERKHGRVR